MPLLTMLPAIFQTLLGLMAVAEKINTPGAKKKELVIAGVQALTPALTLLPASTQQNIRDEAPKVAQVAEIASGMIEVLHPVLKANDLYPAIESQFAAVGEILDGVSEAIAAAPGD